MSRKNPILVLLVLLGAPRLLAGIPEIKSLKKNESITIEVMYSEPAISRYQYTFRSGEVTIKENDKELGNLKISPADAEKIDAFLESVERARKAKRSLLGAPEYAISSEESGRATGVWKYRIDEPKKTEKPTLSLNELRKRLP